MKNISELTEKERETLTTTWAERFNKSGGSKAFYQLLLCDVKEGEIDTLPHFLVLELIKMGYYKMPKTSSLAVKITKDECSAGSDPTVNHFKFASELVRDEFVRRWVEFKKRNHTLVTEEKSKDGSLLKIVFEDKSYLYTLELCLLPLSNYELEMEDLNDHKYQLIYW